MVRYSENLLCFAICDIYIYLKNLGDGQGLNDCAYISRLIFTKSKKLKEYDGYLNPILHHLHFFSFSMNITKVSRGGAGVVRFWPSSAFQSNNIFWYPCNTLSWRPALSHLEWCCDSFSFAYYLTFSFLKNCNFKEFSSQKVLTKLIWKLFRTPIAYVLRFLKMFLVRTQDSQEYVVQAFFYKFYIKHSIKK